MFKAAQPIWLQNQEEDLNVTVATTAEFNLSKLQAAGRISLRISGMTRYRVYLNGKYIGNGPKSRSTRFSPCGRVGPVT